MSKGERGFTLLEILVALAVFAFIIVGALGAIGATNAGGFMDGFPTALVAGRTAKDYTVASVYLQAFQEYMARYVDAGTLPTVLGTTPFTQGAAGIFGFAVPSAYPYQLDWTQVVVEVERWYWACGSEEYSPSAPATNDQVILVRTALEWDLKGQTRDVVVQRYVPYRPDTVATVTPCP